MTDTITDIVLTSGAPGTFDSDGGDFDLLREGVIAAGFAEALSDPDAELTVFAPIDDSFIGLAQALGYTGSDEAGTLNFLLDALALLGEGDPITPLADILSYHVLAGAVFEADVAGLDDGTAIETLLGAPVVLDLDTTPISLIDADDGIPNPGIIATDIVAENGVIHALNGVLIPLPVTDLLSQPGTDFVIGTGTGDSIATRGGDDFINGKGGSDDLNGGGGNDVILGGSQGDILHGRRGEDVLRGENGADQLRGGAGDDIIDGGAGKDLLAGGGGNDTFVFGVGSDRDILLNFRQGSDVVDMSGSGVESFDDLDISGNGHRAKIDLGDGDVLVMIGVGAGSVTESDFIFA